MCNWILKYLFENKIFLEKIMKGIFQNGGNILNRKKKKPNKQQTAANIHRINKKKDTCRHTKSHCRKPVEEKNF